MINLKLYEGFVEEGGQGWSSEYIQDYFKAKYNADYNNDVSSMLMSAAKGFKETYGTAQGLQEVVIGMIVGAIGVPGIGGSHLPNDLSDLSLSGGTAPARLLVWPAGESPRGAPARGQSSRPL